MKVLIGCGLVGRTGEIARAPARAAVPNARAMAFRGLNTRTLCPQAGFPLKPFRDRF